MFPGYMPVEQGMYWFPKDVKPRADMMAEQLPGTSSIMRYARIEAHHCVDCSIVAFKYGRQLPEEEE
jgi:hypothetical protein